MKIFATGTSGTIGKHLKNVEKVDLRLEQRDLNLPLDFLTAGNCFLHLAGVVGVNKVEKNSTHAHRVNVSAVESLAKQVFNATNNRFVYVSTSHVYEKSKFPINETFGTAPGSLYARQKLEAENLLKEIFSSNSERLCIVRVFSVLDWGGAPSSLGGGIAKLMDSESDYILKHADDVRDFLTPKTIASALCQICNTSSLSGVVNLCSNQGVSVGQAAEEMLRLANWTVPYDRIKRGYSDSPVIIGDNSKLRHALPNLNLDWVPSWAV